VVEVERKTMLLVPLHDRMVAVTWGAALNVKKSLLQIPPVARSVGLLVFWAVVSEWADEESEEWAVGR
jgi:hypothetical protein